jgi:hypothetical protein
LGKGRFVCTAAQSIAAVELLLLLLLLLGSRRKKKRKKVIGFAVSKLPLQISCDGHESSIIVLVQVGFGSM